MDVVGHDDEGMEAEVAFAAIVLEGVEEEFGGYGGLEETPAIVGLGGDEEGTVAGETCGLAHVRPSVPQRLKPLL